MARVVEGDDDPTPEGIYKQAEVELREEFEYRPGRLEKLLDFYSHPGYIGHKIHILVACDSERDQLEMEDALVEIRKDYRCDPEAAPALWSYAGESGWRR